MPKFHVTLGLDPRVFFPFAVFKKAKCEKDARVKPEHDG
jgi:hypothetical protein